MSSFVADKIVMDGLTFDDVLLIPAFSEVLPRTVELKTKFSRNIELNIPFVTAAMDTVTESSMAIAIAREGGIGVIHKNMSVEEQARQVAIVKRAENGMIYDPVTIRKGRTVRDALMMMAEYHIGGIPVVDEDNHLVGIVTNRDLRFERRLDKNIDEVMTKDNLVTTHQQTDLAAAAQILQENKIEKLPVVDKNNRLVGLITYKDITKAKDKPMACKDEKGRLRVAAGVGVTADTIERMEALVNAGADAIVIDTAHGHSKFVVEKLAEAKKMFPNVDIVVGNVATGEAARMLVENGADAIKVGIGPGSICTTRVVAGVGVPQLSAVYDVFCALKGTGVPLIADGGLRRVIAEWVRSKPWRTGRKTVISSRERRRPRNWCRRASLAVCLSRAPCRRSSTNSWAACAREWAIAAPAISKPCTTRSSPASPMPVSWRATPTTSPSPVRLPTIPDQNKHICNFVELSFTTL